MEIRSVHPFLDYYTSIRGRTRRVVQLIPADSFDWSPAPGRFSFADLVRHIAAFERWVFAENAAGRPARYPGHGRELADGPERVRQYFDAMHAQTLAILGALSDEDLGMKCITPAGAPIGVGKWLRAMVEHETHHRGQLYLMLGLIGVPTPPVFGLTSEEVQARSLSMGLPAE